MPYYDIILFLLVIAIGVSALTPKLMIPYPVMLMLTGILVGFIPGIEYEPVSSNVIFLLFLPPILYDAAINIPFKDFRRNIKTISMMAVLLVFVTMAAIAAVAYYCVPGINWPIAFLIGAILSPPDAVAATGILKDIPLPNRTKTILEGESLVNDASALTAYRIALGVVAGGVFEFWNAGVEFLVVISGGALIGLGLAFIFIAFLRKVRLSSNATVSLSIILPFAAYQFAEMLDVSGVIAVVVMGLKISKSIHDHNLFSMSTVIQSKSVWSLIIYMLNGLIFILIGLEFPLIWDDIPRENVLPLFLSGFLIFIVAMAVRLFVVFEHRFLSGRLIPDGVRILKRKKKKRPGTPVSLDWKNSLIIGWSGMRGIVSVATAIALPVTFSSGEVFPQRNSIIFLTVVVVILMLVIQGLGLPILVKLLKIQKED